MTVRPPTPYTRGGHRVDPTGATMQRLPDLMQSGGAVLHCVLSKFKTRKGSILREWTLTFRTQLEKREKLGILPEQLRVFRQALVQARAGGWPFGPCPIRCNLDGTVNITIEPEEDDDESSIVVVNDHEVQVERVVLTSTEGRFIMDYRLVLVAHPTEASGLVALEGRKASIGLKIVEGGKRQPDLWTRPEDLPQHDPELPLGDQLPAEPGDAIPAH